MNKYNVLAVCSIVMVVVLGIATAMVCADSTTTSNAADAIGIKLPAWLQGLLGIGGTAGSGAIAAWALIKKRIAKAILLYEDCKLVISEFIDVANYVRAEIKTDEAKKEWNESIDAMAKLLMDTGNASLVQKGQALLKKKV